MAKSLKEIRKQPGMSNAGKYEGLITAGPHGTYPINEVPGGPPTIRRINALRSLSHHLGPRGESKMLKRAGSLLKKYGKFPSLANKLLRGK